MNFDLGWKVHRYLSNVAVVRHVAEACSQEKVHKREQSRKKKRFELPVISILNSIEISRSKLHCPPKKGNSTACHGHAWPRHPHLSPPGFAQTLLLTHGVVMYQHSQSSSTRRKFHQILKVSSVTRLNCWVLLYSNNTAKRKSSRRSRPFAIRQYYVPTLRRHLTALPICGARFQARLF